MIDFKDKDSQVPSTITVISLLIIVGTLLYMAIVKAPQPANVFQLQKQQQLMRRQDEQARMDTTQKTAVAEQLIYHGSAEDIMAHVLAQMTNQAMKLEVQVTAFRPQKTQSLTGLTEIPVVVQVSGPYPALLSFVNALSLPASKVAVRSFQVAANGDATSNVAATIGISIYTPETDDDDATSAKTNAKSTPAPAKPMASDVPASAAPKGGSSG